MAERAGLLSTRLAVYGLHSGDGVIRYVGQTRSGTRQRLAEHRSSARSKREGARVYNWIRQVGLDNLQIVLLAVPASQEEMNLLERQEIAKRSNLLNHEPGGLHGKPYPRRVERSVRCKKDLHDIVGENVAWNTHGTKRCRECLREKERRRTARRRAIREGYPLL